MVQEIEVGQTYFDVAMGPNDNFNFNDEIFFSQHDDGDVLHNPSQADAAGYSYVMDGSSRHPEDPERVSPHSPRSSRSSFAAFNADNTATASTTPEFSSPPPQLTKAGRFPSTSLPIEQLNLLSIRPMIPGSWTAPSHQSAAASAAAKDTIAASMKDKGLESAPPTQGASGSSASAPAMEPSSLERPSSTLSAMAGNNASPSPEYNLFSMPYDNVEERTINPRKLLNDITSSAMGMGRTGHANSHSGHPVETEAHDDSTYTDDNKTKTFSPSVSTHDNSTLNLSGVYSDSPITNIVLHSNAPTPSDSTSINSVQAGVSPSTHNYILPSSSSSPALSSIDATLDSPSLLNNYRNSTRDSSINRHNGSASQAFSSDNKDSVSYAKSKSYSVSGWPDMPIRNKFNFDMNNECFDAISYWINDTLQNVNSKLNENGEESLGRAEEIMVNPTGVIKADHYKRRNSIQVASRSAAMASMNFRNASVNTMRSSHSHSRSLGSTNFRSALQGAANSSAIADGSDDYSAAIADDVDTKPGPLPSVAQKKKRRKSSHTSSSPTYSGREDVTYTQPIAVIHNIPPLKSSQDLRSGNDDDEEKPFPCTECSKQFKRSEHLKRHIRSVHSNIRPFHCKYCEKKFSRSDNLAQHLKTHYKLNGNGSTTIIYGNPNLHNRGGRKKSSE
ncbi:Piso0_001469 [Millerozyma farinosa CBS 7064]|uniref:Piso0_001469 protein n=1 Tax=Pichia sorbitophila (strain ATCC MYA-4447 / BCRC 22081 / CBS 7064 / NBRC 10061 / NRRL Y-12695) TaxID=559304 RepID=G8YN91_PICSO|nr:Piso0_001469 [Millerozyma farinosa CBS 7064]